MCSKGSATLVWKFIALGSRNVPTIAAKCMLHMVIAEQSGDTGVTDSARLPTNPRPITGSV